MSEKIKVAIIGCGAIANSAHIPAYMKNEKAEIKYFCDIIPERADAAVEKYGCGKAVYDYHEILDDPELDSVSVCTHNDLHSVIAIDFMRAGKDVLSEKPAARVAAVARKAVGRRPQGERRKARLQIGPQATAPARRGTGKRPFASARRALPSYFAAARVS